ncbi:MAG: DUF5018 domain-containing protein, partial [Helicobacteraceae bacterium]|nr:DUF5018 domain-containing protein [Helicobacteraceae bacterium]
MIGCGGGGGGSSGGNNGGNPILSSAKDITSFSFSNGAIKPFAIVGTEINGTIDYYSTNLTPSVVVSPQADYTPKTAVTTFGEPITYTVTAQDSSTKDYQVRVRRAIVINNETDLARALTDIGNDGTLTQIDLIFNIGTINLSSAFTIPSSWSSKGIVFENNTTGQGAIVIGNLID